jgi:crotonobetainyl-CoA:carnitine CoA-transferase CaiB-like acyl-CoA transferase
MLKGLRVVEMASVLAGPAVGQFFAECGAEVIKIENPETGGDVTRSWKGAGETAGDRSAYFCSVNWGKKSVMLDLRKDTHLQKLLEITRLADIAIVSYKPGDARRLRVDYDSLRAVKPDLIYGSVTGYGPDDKRVGYDAVIQAESGFMDLNGEPGRGPLKMPVALIDLMAAHQMKEGLLLALLHRDRTGKGCKVEVSLIDSAIASLANQATNYLVAGTTPRRQGSLHPNISPYGEVVTTRDGARILLAVGSDKQFSHLCRVLGHPAWAEDPRFTTNQSRVQNRSALGALLHGAFSKVEAETILSQLHDGSIPAGLIQTVPAALRMPGTVDLGLSGTTLRGLRTFVARLNMDAGTALSTLPEPPRLGEHNAQFGLEA